MLTPDEGAAVAAAKNPVRHSPSPSQSPVPYLFGGLAAMMGLIACAVLILICSYWRLTGPLGAGDDADRDPEAGDGNGNDGSAPAPAVVEEKFLVILAGQEKPTCLATPVASRVSSFGSNCSCSSSTVSSESSTLGKSDGENDQKKEDFNGGGQVEMETTVHRQTLDRVSRS